jgi:hypothetical protein
LADKDFVKFFYGELHIKVSEIIVFIISVSGRFVCCALRSFTFGSRYTTFEIYKVTIIIYEGTEEMKKSVIAIMAPNLIGGLFLIVIRVIVTLYCCIAVCNGKQMHIKRNMLGNGLNKNKGNENGNNKKWKQSGQRNNNPSMSTETTTRDKLANSKLTRTNLVLQNSRIKTTCLKILKSQKTPNDILENRQI